MACVSSCPSGVRYDRLIESTRAAVEDEVERPLGDRFVRGLLFRLLPYPGRMRAALTLAPIGRALPMPKRLRPLVEIAPRWRGHGDRPDRDSRCRTRHAHGSACSRAASSARCFPDVNAATARVLAADGFEVVAPPQGCCGALSVHAGRLDEGKAFARALVDAFQNVDLVVVNSSGCGSHLKELGWLLGDERAESFSAKVRDVGELLGSDMPRARAPSTPDEGRAAGLVPPPPRTAAPALVAVVALPHPRARGRRAGRAGPLLRLGRDLQRRAGGRCARARRPQGRARPRDRRAGVRERESRLPRPGIPGAATPAAAAAGASPRRAHRCLDPKCRVGSTARDALRR